MIPLEGSAPEFLASPGKFLAAQLRHGQMDIPGHESAVEIPRRMVQFFLEVKKGDEDTDVLRSCSATARGQLSIWRCATPT
ncbi:hypothetical protein GCM10010383_50720 [Streptomyces lomondensis]|uniref:Uncharacterized protein n=1 Tax=Streptomyces lomondensis TaxID=68229 RepID=A0ABQ2XFJ2_9ACTN|nr:hypothetical protein GCM10010383_50720 [Streptomyces lomondensis]